VSTERENDERNTRERLDRIEEEKIEGIEEKRIGIEEKRIERIDRRIIKIRKKEKST
jgi:hypothetical protein